MVWRLAVMSVLDDLHRELIPIVGKQKSTVVCKLIASRFGGDNVYIPQKFMLVEITHQDTPKTIQRRYGVSRSTANTWINQWKQ